MLVLYITIVLIVTTIGSISGIGGGIIIKPIFDLLGDYDTSTIGALVSFVLLAMSAVSIFRNVTKSKKIQYTQLIFISIGSIIGGICGQSILEKILIKSTNDLSIKLTQNIIIGILIVFTIIYSFMKNIKSFNCNKKYVFILVGFFLGMISAFLGIGGGPVNMAIIIIVFGLDIKEAVIYSLSIIMFAQISKIITISFTSGFSGLDLSLLPYLVISGVVGGLIGSLIQHKISSTGIKKLFNIMQIIILVIVIINIIRFISF